MTIVQKVAAYIVRPPAEKFSLLAFSQPEFPDLALQPPGGTVDPGESPEGAVWREIEEESGLTGLTLVDKIGEHPFILEGVPHIRHFYLFNAPAGLPDTWMHTVTGEGGDVGFVYVYEWLRPTEFDRMNWHFRIFLDQLAFGLFG